jgi:hypothetical protein
MSSRSRGLMLLRPHRRPALAAAWRSSATRGPHGVANVGSPGPASGNHFAAQQRRRPPGCTVPKLTMAGGVDRAPIARPLRVARVRRDPVWRLTRPSCPQPSTRVRPARLRDAEVGSSNIPHPTPAQAAPRRRLKRAPGQSIVRPSRRSDTTTTPGGAPDVQSPA